MEAGTTRRKSSRRRSPHDLGSADLATWLRETRPSQARSSEFKMKCFVQSSGTKLVNCGEQEKNFSTWCRKRGKNTDKAQIKNMNTENTSGLVFTMA
ncbi:hypothetical protein HPB50_028466 [Hyalomma asiaticum]|nr:hypothetical protein HPB50_028466 [Hyalomma asiaticum]